jgi:hypothetical protein
MMPIAWAIFGDRCFDVNFPFAPARVGVQVVEKHIFLVFYSSL